MYEKRTNLGPSEDWREYVRRGIVAGPQSNEQQDTDSVEGRRLDKHGDNRIVQSASRGWSPHGFSELPVMQYESGNDHEC